MNGLAGKILLFFKGLAMGAADVVPGVSGGTIAFITGIYQELLDSISSIKPNLLNTLKKEGVAAVWEKINGTFLLVLFSGIATSILTLARVISYLLHHHPIPLWSFFFGLILASIIYVGKELSFKKINTYVGLIAGTLFVLWLSISSPLPPSDSYLFLFGAGFIAICAMILPGVSGSFILLLIGAYTTVIQAVKDFDIAKIAAVGLGAILGLLSFSRLLNWLLKNYRNGVVAVLTGFLIGSLWKIWPWKIDKKVFHKELGIQPLLEITENKFSSLSAYLKTLDAEKAELFKSYVEDNILPNTYEALNQDAEAHFLSAVLFCLLGFGLLFLIEFIAKSLKS